jgi:hypothetical protein
MRMEPAFGKSLLVDLMVFVIPVAIPRSCAVKGTLAMSVVLAA